MSVLIGRVGRLLSAISLSCALGVVTSAANIVEAQPTAVATIDDFFRDFTADWIRHDPELARRTRLLSGSVQDELERHLTPRTRAWREERIDRAQRGLASLAKFDKAALTASQRLSG